MEFRTDHYVPVLKLKRGEKTALGLISQRFHARIVPLLEIVERGEDEPKSVDAHLDNAFKRLPESVAPYSRCFLDTREIADDEPNAAREAFERAHALALHFTPVTGISRTSDLAAALEYQTHGIAIRLTRKEFEQGGIADELLGFMHNHGLVPESTDLLVDLGALDDLIVEGVRALAHAFLTELPDQSRWRTMTLSGCSFPLSMGVVDRQSYRLWERAEWNAWRHDLYVNRDALQRLPTFSDCAVQHPLGVEGFNPRTMQSSASVRYTVSDDWLLMKGEGARVTPVKEQFPELATRLVYGHLRKYFASADHCAGCGSIEAAADGAPKLGSAEVWRRLGTIHHITTVVEALASLP